MTDTEDQEFDESFKGFGEDPAPVTPPTDPATPPATPPVVVEPPKVDPPKPVEEPKKDEKPETPPAEPPKKEGEEATPPTDPTKKPEETPKPPETPETPPTPPEEPKPLTLDDVKSVISEVRTEERISGQALETATKDVLEAYYPEGLSNVLTDTSGKELKSPQDVVDASGGKMSMDEAAQWLMNEQFKLDQDVAKIKADAENIAKTTLKFKQDGVDVLTRYEPVFKMYPQLQQKVWNEYKKLVKADEAKNVILSAPDMREFYDIVLEPYRLAVEYQTGKPGTAAIPAETPPAAPAPPTPSAEDRLDDSGDGGTTAPNDPNDFAQQVSKELAKGI